jgi:ABC-2 type transport system permease protein
MKLFRGFGAILYKEFIVMMRDPMTLFFMLFPPLIQMIAFGYALDTDVKNMGLIVYDQARTVESRQLVDRFVNTETFKVVGHVDSVAEMESEIRKGHAYAALQIPPNFSRDLRAGRGVTVQLAIDGSNSTTALQALNTATAVTMRESIAQILSESGRTAIPIEVRPQMLFNPAMKSPNFFIPGVIGLVLQMATLFTTAMAIVRERERGTLEQLLVSPVSRWGLMLGKLIPYFCLGSAMAALLLVIMRVVFGVPIAGSLVGLSISMMVYVFTLLSIGLLISTKAENQMQALQMTMALILPSVFFSGFIFPRETMPWIFYAVSTLLPATYAIDLLRAIVLRGANFAEYWPSLAILCAMAVGFFSLCAVRFKRKIG